MRGLFGAAGYILKASPLVLLALSGGYFYGGLDLERQVAQAFFFSDDPLANQENAQRWCDFKGHCRFMRGKGNLNLGQALSKGENPPNYNPPPGSNPDDMWTGDETGGIIKNALYGEL